LVSRVTLTIYRTNLAAASERWNCIQDALPEEVSEDVATLIDDVSAFMQGASTLSTPIYASGQLSKTLEAMVEIEQEVVIDCKA
jgi:hypothetical protein